MNEKLKEIMQNIEDNFQKYPVTCFSLICNMEDVHSDNSEIIKELKNLKKRITEQKEFSKL